MRIRRLDVAAGLACAVPAAAWMAFVSGADAPDAFGRGVAALWAAQVLVATVSAPLEASEPPAADRLAGAAAQAWIPAPVACLAWLGGGVTAGCLAGGLARVTAYALALAAAGAFVGRWAERAPWRPAVLAAARLLAAGALWGGRSWWLA